MTLLHTARRKYIAFDLLTNIDSRPAFKTPVPIVDTYEVDRMLSNWKDRNAFIEYSVAKDALGTSLKSKKKKQKAAS